jgi:DnaJ-class molecular chaperone
LGIKEDATEQDIKKAYYALAKKHHPDTASESKESGEKFKDISNAYDVLSDPEKRG